MADLGGLTKTATGAVGGAAPGVVPDAGSAVPGGAPANGAPAEGADPKRDALLGNIADVDLAKGKDLLNVGGEQGQGNVNLLTKDSPEKTGNANGASPNSTNRPSTNGDNAGGPGTQQDGKGSHGKSCPPSNGVFYAYATQVGTDKKYLMTFANAKVANDYFDRVAEVHKEKAFRAGDQFLSLDPTVSIESATKGVAFNQFQGQMFVQEIDGTQPIVPPQNKKGYIMGQCCRCECPTSEEDFADPSKMPKWSSTDNGGASNGTASDGKTTHTNGSQTPSSQNTSSQTTGQNTSQQNTTQQNTTQQNTTQQSSGQQNSGQQNSGQQSSTQIQDQANASGTGNTSNVPSSPSRKRKSPNVLPEGSTSGQNNASNTSSNSVSKSDTTSTSNTSSNTTSSNTSNSTVNTSDEQKQSKNDTTATGQNQTSTSSSQVQTSSGGGNQQQPAQTTSSQQKVEDSNQHGHQDNNHNNASHDHEQRHEHGHNTGSCSHGGCSCCSSHRCSWSRGHHGCRPCCGAQQCGSCNATAQHDHPCPTCGRS